MKVFGSAAGDVIDIAPSPVPGNARVTASNIPAFVDVAGATDTRRQGPRRPGHDLRCERPRGAARARRSSGGDGYDTLNGGDGPDRSSVGRRTTAWTATGAPTSASSAPADTFVWDPGDGSDIVEEQGGTDTLLFNGSGGSENFDFSANGNRFRFFRDLGNITMDTDNVERVDLEALGGADNAVVNDLDGTDVTLANIDLEGVLGSGAGDGQPDNVVINGSNARDDFRVRRDGAIVDVVGLDPRVRIAHSEAANDRLDRSLGNDRFFVGAGLGALIQLTVNQ